MRELDRFRCVSWTSPGWGHPGTSARSDVVAASPGSSRPDLADLGEDGPGPGPTRVEGGLDDDLHNLVAGDAVGPTHLEAPRRDRISPATPTSTPGGSGPQIDQTGTAFTVAVTG